jgi:hypothetical protein
VERKRRGCAGRIRGPYAFRRRQHALIGSRFSRKPPRRGFSTSGTQCEQHLDPPSFLKQRSVELDDVKPVDDALAVAVAFVADYLNPELQ